jgi:SDR family mycofactocin-dependent oxidoreductase
MRVALVTGASGGIGTATVRRLVTDGYAVVGLDVAPASVVDERYVHLVGDVRTRDSLDAAVSVALERWGGLDAVVAAAAMMAGGRPLWETPLEELDELWDVDARGVWLTAAATVPAMLSGPDPSRCRFVALASAAGTYGLFRLAGYTAVKHAVVGIVKGLAADLVGTGVTAVAVSPGSTDTPMLRQTAAIYDDADVDDLVGHQFLRRVLTPDELADTIAFCCSPAGAVLNGSVVHADGGFPG